MVYHRIKSEDTLGAIARKYGTSVSELCPFEWIEKYFCFTYRSVHTYQCWGEQRQHLLLLQKGEYNNIEREYHIRE